MKKDRDPLLTVVTASWPPQVNGTAVVISNLFAEYPGRISVIAGHDEYAKCDPAFQPPCPTTHLCTGGLSRIYPRLFSALRRRCPELFASILEGSIYRMLRKLEPDVVQATFPYDIYLVATVRAARRLRLPVYVHMNDLWQELCITGTAEARFAKRWEPIILKEATRVLCATEAMQEHYEQKYGVQMDLLPHCIPEKDFLAAPSTVRPPYMPCPTVLFVGGVNDHMNTDALKVLASAVDLLAKEYQLHLSTASDLETLSRKGISSNCLRVSCVSRAEARRLEAEAHVLVAPLSHNGGSRDQVRTILSSKLLSYFISGRPIVVFAPEDSYQAESARKNGWAYVVSNNSAAALAQAIEKVATDQDLAAKLVQGALKEAGRRRAKVHAMRLYERVIADLSHNRSLASTVT